MKSLRIQPPLLAAVLACASVAGADPGYESGNIVLAHWLETSPNNWEPAILEYTPGGSLQREIFIPDPPGVTSFELRDLVVDSDRRIHVVLRDHGGGNLILGTYTPPGGWSFQSPADWSHRGVTYYCAIGINEDYIFCPDQTFGGDDTEGILRFPLDDLANPQHFSFPGWNFHAVKVGLNGFVYAINKEGDCAWFHPDTMAMIDRLPPGKLFQAASVINFAVDELGRFYTVDLDDLAHRLESDGTHIESIDGGNALGDVEVALNGDVLISGANRSVIMTDVTYDTVCEFPVPPHDDPSSWKRCFLTFADPVLVGAAPPVPPEITGIAWAAGTFTVDFNSLVGRSYYLERSTTLADWERVGGSVDGSGAVLSLEDKPADPSGPLFYRVGCEFSVP